MANLMNLDIRCFLVDIIAIPSAFDSPKLKDHKVLRETATLYLYLYVF